MTPENFRLRRRRWEKYRTTLLDTPGVVPTWWTMRQRKGWPRRHGYVCLGVVGGAYSHYIMYCPTIKGMKRWRSWKPSEPGWGPWMTRPELVSYLVAYALET